MVKEIEITIENNLILEKRPINVYHHAERAAHLISRGRGVTLPLQTIQKSDYVHISIASGPSDLEFKTIVNLPSWLDFEFLSDGNLSVLHLSKRTLLKIPPGLPGWQLRVTRSSSSFKHSSDCVTISDELPEYP
jgi:hypothetical protein